MSETRPCLGHHCSPSPPGGKDTLAQCPLKGPTQVLEVLGASALTSNPQRDCHFKPPIKKATRGLQVCAWEENNPLPAHCKVAEGIPQTLARSQGGKGRQVQDAGRGRQGLRQPGLRTMWLAP